jgi:hypothetical protein
MTQQISDVVLYEGDEYDLISAKPWLFDPSRHGLHPIQLDTACHAGFFCKYGVRPGLFVLETLAIGCEKRRPPPFNGRRAVKDKGGYHVFSGLDLHLRYTGTITIGKGRIWPFPDLMRGELGSAYQSVLKLDFSRGQLRAVTDVSDLLGALMSRDEENWNDDFRGGGPG